MSAASSPEQDSSIGDSPALDSTMPGSASRTSSADESFVIVGPPSPSTWTREKSGQSSLGSTSLPPGFPAPTSLSLDSVPALTGHVQDYGVRSPESFASFDLDSCSWRTSQTSLLEDWAEWSENWPQAGMTRNGTSFRLPPSAPRIYEHASGYLPTPLATETGYRKDPYTQGGKALSTVLGGPANPEFVEWLMAVPIGWTDLRLSETASSLRLRAGSVNESLRLNE